MITRTGFGAWAIGGGGWAFGWGPQDDAVSLATMRHALKLGVNWIDTAAAYGLGHSEEVVGRLLRERTPAERPMVFTKCGLIWDPNNPMARRNACSSRNRSGRNATLRCGGWAWNALISTNFIGLTKPARR
jgi:aryl-alcohol dehydrogenase-like predicted oxidoreductase